MFSSEAAAWPAAAAPAPADAAAALAAGAAAETARASTLYAPLRQLRKGEQTKTYFSEQGAVDAWSEQPWPCGRGIAEARDAGVKKFFADVVGGSFFLVGFNAPSATFLSVPVALVLVSDWSGRAVLRAMKMETFKKALRAATLDVAYHRGSHAAVRAAGFERLAVGAGAPRVFSADERVMAMWANGESVARVAELRVFDSAADGGLGAPPNSFQEGPWFVHGEGQLHPEHMRTELTGVVAPGGGARTPARPLQTPLSRQEAERLAAELEREVAELTARSSHGGSSGGMPSPPAAPEFGAGAADVPSAAGAGGSSHPPRRSRVASPAPSAVSETPSEVERQGLVQLVEHHHYKFRWRYRFDSCAGDSEEKTS